MQLGSEQRVQVGLALADYSAVKIADRRTVDARMMAELGEWIGSTTQSMIQDEALESYSLYLSEKDGQKLWQELSNRKVAGPDGRATLGASAPSVDSLLTGLDPKAAAEVCSRLDFGTLSLVLSQVSGETHARIYQGLPKGLQSRLTAVQTPGADGGARKAPNEAEQMTARARLRDAYRKFDAESSV